MFGCHGCVCLNMLSSLRLAEYLCLSALKSLICFSISSGSSQHLHYFERDCHSTSGWRSFKGVVSSCLFCVRFLICPTPSNLNYSFSFQTVLCSPFSTLLIFFYFCGMLGQKGRLSTQSATWVPVFFW